MAVRQVSTESGTFPAASDSLHQHRPQRIVTAEPVKLGRRLERSSERSGGQVRRLLALALILEGHSREVAAELAGMERQTLPDWVHRYNAQGVAGLCSIRIGGRRSYLSEAQMAELKAVAIKGPDWT